MVEFFLHIFDYFQKHKHLCFGMMVSVTAIILLMTATLTYNENIYDFLPVSGNEQKAITLYQDITGGQRVVAMFKTKPSTPNTQYPTPNTQPLTDAVDFFQEELQAHDGKKHIREITTQVDFDKVASITEFIYQNIPVMLNDSDYLRMEQLIQQPEYIDEQLASDVQMIMMPATGFFSSSISSDPLALFSPVMQRLQERQTTLPVEIDDGYLFTPGRQHAIAMITSPYGAMESANNKLLVDYIDSIAQLTMSKMPDVEVGITGSPVIAVGNANQIKTDSQWAISIAVTLILLLLIFAFRRVKNLLLIAVAIIFGWLFAMGFIAILRNDVSLIVLGIGSIIIGIAVNYPLHFIAHTSHGGTTREVLKEMVSPLLIGNITTVGAFASLMPLNAPALRDLGFFAAFMLIGTIFFVLIFLPHLVSQRLTKQKEQLSFARISDLTPEKRPAILWAIIILTPVFAYFSFKTSFDTNMHHINYMTDSQKQLLAQLQASAGVNDTANVYVVTEGDTWNQALNERTRIAPVIDSLKQAKQLKTFSDVTAFICSTDEQQRRINLWNEFWDKHRDDITLALRQKAPQYDFSQEAFTPFFDIINKDYTPQPFEHFETVQTVLLANSFSNSTGKCSVVDILHVGKDNIENVKQTLNTQNSKLKTQNSTLSTYAFDFVGMNSAVAKTLSNDFNYIGFACGFIVFLFLWLSFGRLELAILAFTPMAIGWIWILGIMYLLGIQFNIVNVILATFIFGQGDDYTIFITEGLIYEHTYQKKILASFKNSILISALIMFIGMGALIVAKHPALHSLAEVTIVGMITVVLMAWIIPPLFFQWLVKTDNKPRRTPVTIGQVIRTVYCAVVYIFELAYGSLFGLFAYLSTLNTKHSTLYTQNSKLKTQLESWFHRVINKTMQTNISHIWGVKTYIHNPHNETFSRGSILISNHQSILDPIFMLALSPKVLILISEKVWKNPLVHTLFKLAGFINLNQPMEDLKKKIAEAVNNGYNVVIFPEGKRNLEDITRFHKGAFYIAQEINADILPVYLHGAGHVAPKGSGFIARGQIDIEIGQRIPAEQLSTFGETHQDIAKHFHHHYIEHFDSIKRKIEDTHYFHHYLISQYSYKGIQIEKETRRLLKKHNDYTTQIDNFTTQNSKLKTQNSTLKTQNSPLVSILNTRHGQFPLLFALVHPDIEVHSYAYEDEHVAVAKSCQPLPPNLHIFLADNEQTARQSADGTHIITLPNP